MRGRTTRYLIEKQYGGEIGDILAERLREGYSLKDLAREWDVSLATIYNMARASGLDTYWVKDGTEILARVP